MISKASKKAISLLLAHTLILGFCLDLPQAEGGRVLSQNLASFHSPAQKELLFENLLAEVETEARINRVLNHVIPEGLGITDFRTIWDFLNDPLRKLLAGEVGNFKLLKIELGFHLDELNSEQLTIFGSLLLDLFDSFNGISDAANYPDELSALQHIILELTRKIHSKFERMFQPSSNLTREEKLRQVFKVLIEKLSVSAGRPPRGTEITTIDTYIGRIINLRKIKVIRGDKGPISFDLSDLTSLELTLLLEILYFGIKEAESFDSPQTAKDQIHPSRKNRIHLLNELIDVIIFTRRLPIFIAEPGPTEPLDSKLQATIRAIREFEPEGLWQMSLKEKILSSNIQLKRHPETRSAHIKIYYSKNSDKITISLPTTFVNDSISIDDMIWLLILTMQERRGSKELVGDFIITTEAIEESLEDSFYVFLLERPGLGAGIYQDQEENVRIALRDFKESIYRDYLKKQVRQKNLLYLKAA